MADITQDMPVLGRSGFGPVGRVLLALSRQLAIAGGLVFVALVAMSIVSITGRKLLRGRCRATSRCCRCARRSRRRRSSRTATW